MPLLLVNKDDDVPRYYIFIAFAFGVMVGLVIALFIAMRTLQMDFIYPGGVLWL